jgi:hypothetical protein
MPFLLISLSFEENAEWSGGVRYLQEKGKTNNVAINLFLPKRGTASEVAGCKRENYCMK